MRKKNEIRHSNRAISPIIAVLLMIAIAVVASLVVYAWVMGYIGANTARAGQALQIQSYAVDPAGSKDLMVYIQNIGQSPVTLSPSNSVYVNSAIQSFVGGQITLAPGMTAALNVTYTSWTPGNLITIKVVTSGGAFAQVTGTGITTGSTSSGSSGSGYSVTFATSGGGGTSITNPTGTQTYTPGQQVSISATPSAGYTFSSWSATGSITFANANSASTTATVNGAGTITAAFAQNTVAITITSSTTGSGFVTVDGTGITTPDTFNWVPSTTHTITAATTPVSGSTGVQYVFSSWSDSGATSHTYTVPSSAATVTANFQTQYKVTFTTSPSGSGSTTPSTATWYNAGATGQAISATANSGYTFSSWSASPSGSITFASSTSASTTMAITAASTVTATFQVSTGTFGYTTQGSSSTNGNIENYIVGSIFSTPSVSVTAQSITAYVQVTGTHTIKAAIYTSSGTYIAGTQEVSVTTSNDGWVTFNFATGVPLTANTNYLLVVWANSGSGSANLYYTSSGGSGRYYQTTYATNWPTSPSFTTTLVGSYDYSIYCTYSIP